MKVSELFEAAEVNVADFTVDEVSDGKYKVNTSAIKGPHVAAIKSMYYEMAGKPRTFKEITTKVGGKIDYRTFKSNGFLVKASSKEAVQAVVDKIVAKTNKTLVKAEKWKAGADDRKKEASASSARAQKVRMAAADEKYGKGTYARVKIRQVGGDDGYQYNVFVDGRSIMNGLTKSSAEYEADSQRLAIAKREKIGKFAAK